MNIKVALIGNPNCGKTTLFNSLTGSKQYVGNWPGVTVEKKEGIIKKNRNITIVDLPGIYSLSPYSPEEIITRNFLFNDSPDVILNIVDVTNIERNLYLTHQLLEIGIPVIIALNMIDTLSKSDKIDIEGLKEKLGCAVVEISALKGIGLKKIADEIIHSVKSKKAPKSAHCFSDNVENAISQIETLIKDNENTYNLRWFAIKVFERDKRINEKLSDDIKEKAENIISEIEKFYNDNSESIIINERYIYIEKLVKDYFPKSNKDSVSDKIDKVLTNKWLALPIFAFILWLIYFISIKTLGDYTIGIVEGFFEFIIVKLTDVLVNLNAAEWLVRLITEGIISGVGSVLAFVPQIMILFFFLSILEDCGYMSRIAFIMDGIMRKFGLSGKAFIPLLISSGCGVPGIMASRTIENENDRLITAMTTTFIPCGAKLPIIALIAGSLFNNSAWIASSMYFLGIGMIIISGIILKKIPRFKGENQSFIMELPKYQIPDYKSVLIHMWDRGKSFIIKAGTVIFLACTIIWFMQSFNFKMEMVETQNSMLSVIGKMIAPLFAPLGFGKWEASVATLTGLVAKENIVGTLGVLYGPIDTTSGLWGTFSNEFNAVSGLSFLIFNMICAPCVAAIGAIRREMGSLKMTFFAVGYQTMLAYAVSFIVYQIGKILVLKTPFNIGTLIAALLVLILIFLIGKKEN